MRTSPHPSKITRAKWTGGVAQEVEHLKPLVQTPAPSKKKKERKKEKDSASFLCFYFLVLLGIPFRV
jgi:hypothetical protein